MEDQWEWQPNVRSVAICCQGWVNTDGLCDDLLPRSRNKDILLHVLERLERSVKVNLKLFWSQIRVR